MLTLHKDTLHIDWPFGVKENITITEDEQVRIQCFLKDFLFNWKLIIDLLIN